MWLTEKERVTVTVLGTLALAALSILLWQRQGVLSAVEGRPALTIAGTPVTPAQAMQWDAALASARQVDINTANAAELERLPGVGPTLAQRIVAYRSAHGMFQSPDDLQQVQGIGPKTYETLREYATVE